MNRVTVVENAEHWQRLLAEARTNRARADAVVSPEDEAKAVPGAYFVRLEPDAGLTIYGEIIQPKYPEDRAQYSKPHMRFVRLTKCYSQVEPEGEYGNVHIATMAVFLTKEQFEDFRKAGWPSL